MMMMTLMMMMKVMMMMTTSLARPNMQQQQSQPGLRREQLAAKSFDSDTFTKSFDTLSDTFSVSSDESENFVPRIIRPRRWLVLNTS